MDQDNQRIATRARECLGAGDIAGAATLYGQLCQLAADDPGVWQTHGLLLARVLRTGARTALGRIHRLLDAPIQATSMMRQVDRWAGWLTALAITLAVVGGLRSGMAGG